MQNVSQIECSIRKPKISKHCNLKPCLSAPISNEIIRKSKRNHLAGSYNSHNKNKNKLAQRFVFKVQGKVTIFEGSRIKLLCPEWNNQFTSWYKGHNLITNNKKFILVDNILKIKMTVLTDTGVYKCIYDNNTEHSMFLHVIPKMNNIQEELNDQHIVRTKNIDNQYNKNEQDVSQEMGKYSLKSGPNGFNNENEINVKENNGHKFKMVQQNLVKYNSYSSQENSNDMDGYKIDIENKIHHKNKVQFNWLTTDWSNCTIPCEGFGFKVMLLRNLIGFKNFFFNFYSIFRSVTVNVMQK